MTRRQPITRLPVCNNRPITLFSKTINYTLLAVISLTRRRAAAALNDRPAPGDTVLTGIQICMCVTSLHQGPLTGNHNILARVTPYLRVIKFSTPDDTVLTGNQICVCDVTAPRTTYR